MVSPEFPKAFVSPDASISLIKTARYLPLAMGMTSYILGASTLRRGLRHPHFSTADYPLIRPGVLALNQAHDPSLDTRYVNFTWLKELLFSLHHPHWVVLLSTIQRLRKGKMPGGDAGESR